MWQWRNGNIAKILHFRRVLLINNNAFLTMAYNKIGQWTYVFLFDFEKSEHCYRPKENHVYRIHIKLCALLLKRKMKHMTKKYNCISFVERYVRSFIHSCARCHRYCDELWICDLSTNHISYVQLLSECRFSLLLTHTSANRSCI